ncbi:hypothetical protein HRI_004397400 [Hibiscus trionum]|uniref:Chromo domain-containing protein n=1 Tax=Hibiscus trionum TaxID=183268 RepID=A0A9W7J3C8_HIBTR|nr:hypothetical protein HRI_004397400 [Hibiscus trionum]
MNFVEGLPQSIKFNCILVVIDKYTKYGHFIALSHPYTVLDIAKAYLGQVYKLHVEWWYNTNYNTTLGMTPFEAFYVYKPPIMFAVQASVVEGVQDTMAQRDQLNQTLKDNILRAQHRMKQNEDKKRTEREYQPTKKKIGQNMVTSINPPEVENDSQVRVYPAGVLDKRMVKRDSKAMTQLLVQWVNLGPEQATWEDYTVLKSQFLDFDP